ncbi:MAG TPA: DedA family protein/thiosulfate sulfurtransferase GlpE [Candidatus Acidoferrales bacterium]|nr:DedA family protein/thiosulfate sulfurtransferase GlpE [Candidatus Acidoferrales bacterium]
MNEILQFVSRHGYVVILVWAFAEQAGMPVPALPLLLCAGALAGMGRMNLFAAASVAVLGALASDGLWYTLGRRRGIRVLKMLCRISLEPDSCVRNTQGVFARYGARSLMVAKFVPGLGAAAPPLAGVVRMPLHRFILFDFLGASLWAWTYLSIGYIFSDQLEDVAMRGGRIGGTLLVLIASACAAFLIWKFARRQRFLRSLRLDRITPEELRTKMDQGEQVVVVDLRHPMSIEADPELIPGAIWIDPETIGAHSSELPRDRDIILYCACPTEATSARAALLLKNHGIQRVRPLVGGLDSWRELGYPIVTVEDSGLRTLATLAAVAAPSATVRGSSTCPGPSGTK